MDHNTIDWNEIARRIADFIKLMEYGAYASIGALALGLVNTVLIVVLLVQLNNRLPHPRQERKSND